MQFWNGVWVALEGAPDWMRYGAVGPFVYTFVNFFTAAGFGTGDIGPESYETARAFSGHTMLFYGMAVALNYAQDRRAALGLWRCSAGHEVGPSANFCETCGVPVNGGRAR